MRCFPVSKLTKGGEIIMSNWSEVGIQCGKKVYEKIEEIFLEYPQVKPDLKKKLSDGSWLMYWDAIK